MGIKVTLINYTPTGEECPADCSRDIEKCPRQQKACLEEMKENIKAMWETPFAKALCAQVRGALLKKAKEE